MRCRDFLTFALDFLDPVEDRLRSVEDVFCFVLHCTRETLYFNPGQEISCEDHKQILHLLSRRKAGEPLAYILGRVPFYGCDIEVSCDVLIPRQETELLVDLIVKKMEKGSVRNQVVWDIGCGSGCIGIALKKRFSSLCVSGSDLSEKAVEMAKKNAKRNQVDVEFLVGDLLNPFLHRKCDILVSNPPYVSQKEWETLDPEVKKEPTMALLGGESGLEYYKRFAIDAKKFFYPSAFLFFEMGRGQGKAIQSLFIEEGWGKGKIFMDLEGKDRFFFLEIE